MEIKVSGNNKIVLVGKKESVVILGTLLGFGITGGYLATQKRGVSTTPPAVSQNSTLDPTSTPAPIL